MTPISSSVSRVLADIRSIVLPEPLVPGGTAEVRLGDGRSFSAVLRFDTQVRMDGWRRG